MADQYLTLIQQRETPPLPQPSRTVVYVDSIGMMRTVGDI